MGSVKIKFIISYFFGLLVLFYILELADLRIRFPSDQLISMGLFNIVFFIWALLFDMKKRRYFHPIHLFIFSKIMLLGWGTLYAGLALNEGEGSSLSVSGHLPVEFLVKAVVTLMAGSFAFMLGFYTADDNSREKTMYFHTDSLLRPKDSSLWGIALLGWGVRVWSQNFSFPIATAESFLITMPKAAIFILAMACFSERFKPRYLLPICLMIAVELAFAWHNKMRESFIVVLLPVLLAFAFKTVLKLTSTRAERQKIAADNPDSSARRIVRRGSKKWVFLILSILVAWFMLGVFFPATSMVKKGESENLGEALIAKFQELGQEDKAGGRAEQEIESDLGRRMSVLITSASICVELRETGMTLEYDPVQILLASFVPRLLWKDKPVITSGGWFNKYLLDSRGAYKQSEESKTAMALTAEGELYWAYGPARMILLMSFLGWLVAKIFNRIWNKDLRNVFWTTYFLMISVFLLKGLESSYSYFLSLLMIQYLIAFILSKFASFLFRAREAR